MRTSNAELLAEIDGLAQMSGVEANELEVVKRIEELESNQVQRAFFIIRKRNGQELFFSKKESAESFLNEHASKGEMRLICTGFCDI